ncbi:response regulator transcription factor [Vibrio bathopelagicus]|nr:response regulator transcription factor [Vibrio splendidus]
MKDNQFDSFEALLSHQTNTLTACQPKDFDSVFSLLAKEALTWFKLDRLTLFPNSMILLDTGKSISVSKTDTPQLDMKRFLKGNYLDYLKLLRSKECWQLFPEETLRNHKIDPLRVLHEEGACWHAIVSLSLFGQQWGAIGFSRFKHYDTPIEERDMKRIKLLSDVWLCFWQHSKMTRSVTSDEADNINESEKLLLLTKRQCAVLTQLAQGYTAKQCAEILFLSPRTIESHKYRMLDILDLDNHTELIQFALRNGFSIDNP